MPGLVYHAGALGDFITALPAITAWRRLRGSKPATLLGKPAYAPLAVPAFDEVWDAQSLPYAALFSPGGELAPALRERFSVFDAALLFVSDASPLAGRLAACGVLDILRQAPFPSSPIPIVDYHLSLFPELSPDEGQRLPRVSVSGTVLNGASGSVVLHPGSGSARKNWPWESFRELASRLKADGQRVQWSIGPAEEGLLSPDEPAWRGEPFSALAASLSRCGLYVGNDSGVTHLAAACGCPTIALFDATRPRVWAPRGRWVSVISSNTDRMEEIAVSVVFSECRKLLRSRART
jgi:heptosyltransferase III